MYEGHRKENNAFQTHQHPPAHEKPGAGGGKRLDRRRMLRRSASMLPTILTLYSGAAAARSSNMLRLSDAPTQDDWGRYLCVDETSGTLEGNATDLGDDPQAKVTRISNREYYRKTGNRKVSVQEMCREGGEFRYRESGNGKRSMEGELSDSGIAGTQTMATADLGEDEATTGFEMLGGGGGGGGQGGWNKVQVARGGFSSAVALQSFALRGAVRYKDI